MQPYASLDQKYFWATAVAQRNMFDIDGLWAPKFRIGSKHAVATFGSCFAQHFGRALKAKGYNWLNTEPAPPGISDANAKKFNYGVFTARTGNIYTASLLNQWVQWSQDPAKVPGEVWEKDGRCYDPFRPNIEPNGFADVDEMRASRLRALASFKRSLEMADVFVFTLGLTESWWNRRDGRWWNRRDGYEYPMCPGTLAGTFDAALHQFVNQDYVTINKALTQAIQAIRSMNPSMRFLVTVSPVPLTATMSGQHVLVATMESKSVLRAVAGAVAREFDFVDYFPSYEIINSAPFRGTFFESNQRSVNPAGVAHVMKTFFDSQSEHFGAEEQQVAAAPTAQTVQAKRRGKQSVAQSDVVCEEEILDAFSPTSSHR